MELTSEVDHGDVTSILEIDRKSLSSGQDQSLEGSFTIRNETSEAIPFTFRSGQQYDFFIEGEDGRQYWRWSQDRFFTQMIVTKELRQEPWVYRESIPAVDGSGEPLPPGQYVLRARLVAEKEIENRIGFEITD